MMLSVTPTGVALADLLGRVGPMVAELAVAPAGPQTEVRATVVDDPHDALAVSPGGLLLLVGTFPDEPAALPAVDRAASSGFAGIVVKRHGRDVAPLVEAAAGAGLAVVVAADDVPWRHLDALISSILTSGPARPEDAADGGGEELFSIANAIAAVAGGSVAIEDLGQHVLAYSSIPGQRIDSLRRQGILDRRVPPGPDDLRLYRRVMTAEGIVRFPQMGEDLPRAAAPIRAGTLPLGTLWAIEGDDGLSSQAERAILDGVRLAALHMLRTRSALDLDNLRRGELLRALLEGAGSPRTAWSRLGFAPGDRAALLAVAPGWSRDTGDSVLVTHIAREVGRLGNVLRPDAPVTTSARAVYALVAGPGAGEAARRLADRILAEARHALGGRVYGAVSAEAAGPEAVPRLRDEIDQVLRVTAGGTAGDAGAVATLADVQSAVLLTHLGDELERRRELRHPGLGRLLEHDRRRGTSLAASLLTWLDAQQSVPAAARRLHVHDNTLRHRLRRVREIAAIDLEDGDQRLAAWLELRLSLGAPGATAAPAQTTPSSRRRAPR